MSFSHEKQNGFVMIFPALWIAVAIGFLSVTAMKSNESPTAGNSEAYKQADLEEIVQKEVTGLPKTDEK